MAGTYGAGGVAMYVVLMYMYLPVTWFVAGVRCIQMYLNSLVM